MIVKEATESLVTKEEIGPLFGLPIAHKDYTIQKEF